jgi:hypothetical protein
MSFLPPYCDFILLFFGISRGAVGANSRFINVLLKTSQTLCALIVTPQITTSCFNFEGGNHFDGLISNRGPTIVKNKFTAREDSLLREVISLGRCRDWSDVARNLPGRNTRQCRERWNNYVNPNLTSLPWTYEEEALLISKHAELGSQWQAMIRWFPKRSKNQIKNHWLAIERQMERESSKAAQSKSSTQSQIVFPDEDRMVPADDAGWWIAFREFGCTSE